MIAEIFVCAISFIIITKKALIKIPAILLYFPTVPVQEYPGPVKNSILIKEKSLII